MLWERGSGRPVGPLLSWQDQRTAPHCARLRAGGAGERVRALSGLPLDPDVLRPEGRLAARRPRSRPDSQPARRPVPRHGRLVAAQPLRRRAPDRARQRRADAAARRARARPGIRSCWSCSGSPSEVLPRVVASTGPFPAVRDLAPVPDGTPVTAVMGDSHAALYAHAGWRPGHVKATYGTGSSIMGLGEPPAPAPAPCASRSPGTTGSPRMRVEGNIRATGRHADLARRAARQDAGGAGGAGGASSEGVHLVPAFGGLGAPWWDDEAVGLLTRLHVRNRRAAARASGAGVDRLPGRGRRRGDAPRGASGRHPARRRRADRQRHADAAAGGHERPARRGRSRARAVGAGRRRISPASAPASGLAPRSSGWTGRARPTSPSRPRRHGTREPGHGTQRWIERGDGPEIETRTRRPSSRRRRDLTRKCRSPTLGGAAFTSE